MDETIWIGGVFESGRKRIMSDEWSTNRWESAWTFVLSFKHYNIQFRNPLPLSPIVPLSIRANLAQPSSASFNRKIQGEVSKRTHNYAPFHGPVYTLVRPGARHLRKDRLTKRLLEYSLPVSPPFEVYPLRKSLSSLMAASQYTYLEHDGGCHR